MLMFTGLRLHPTRDKELFKLVDSLQRRLVYLKNPQCHFDLAKMVKQEDPLMWNVAIHDIEEMLRELFDRTTTKIDFAN